MKVSIPRGLTYVNFSDSDCGLSCHSVSSRHIARRSIRQAVKPYRAWFAEALRSEYRKLHQAKLREEQNLKPPRSKEMLSLRQPCRACGALSHMINPLRPEVPNRTECDWRYGWHWYPGFWRQCVNAGGKVPHRAPESLPGPKAAAYDTATLLWRPRKDSNLRPAASKAAALSS
jgi:hypothetical protein